MIQVFALSSDYGNNNVAYSITSTEFIYSANLYFNYVIGAMFERYRDMLNAWPDGPETFYEIVFPKAVINRYGIEQLGKMVDAVADYVRTPIITCEMKPIYQLVLYSVIDYNLEEDIYEDDEFREGDILNSIYSVMCYKNDEVERAIRIINEYYEQNKEDEEIETIYYACANVLTESVDYIFNDFDFQPEELDLIVKSYIVSGGNPQGYDYTYGVRLYDYAVCMNDAAYDAFFSCQKQFEKDPSNKCGSNLCSENMLFVNIYKAMIAVQECNAFIGEKEDTITDGIKLQLKMIYNLRDQTRCGISENGEQAGELDLELEDDYGAYAKIEAIRLSSVDKNKIGKHINKLLYNYNMVGCRNLFLLVYYTGKNLTGFWTKYIAYIKEEQLIREKMQYIETMDDSRYANSRAVQVKMIMNGVSVNWCSIVIQI